MLTSKYQKSIVSTLATPHNPEIDPDYYLSSYIDPEKQPQSEFFDSHQTIIVQEKPGISTNYTELSSVTTECSEFYRKPSDIFAIERISMPKKPQNRPKNHKKCGNFQKLPQRNLKNCPVHRFSLKNHPLKHEAFVTKLHRRFFKAIQHCFNSVKETKPSFLSFVSSSEGGKAAKRELLVRVRRYERELERCVEVEKRPNSEGKRVRGGNSEFGSYSKRFVAEWMGREDCLPEVFFYFCEVLFLGTAKELRKTLKFQCCSGECTEDCEQLWSDLKQYTQFRLLEDLGIPPYIPH